MSEAVAKRIRVHGRVQGVWFRDWTIGQAQALGLDGWVRNRIDGTVEVLAKGPADTVEALIAACHDGPPRAEVERVEIEDTPGIVAAGFVRKPTV